MDSVSIDSGHIIGGAVVLDHDGNIQQREVKEEVCEPSFDNPVMPMPLDVYDSQFPSMDSQVQSMDSQLPSMDSQIPSMDQEKPRKRKQAAPQQVKSEEPATASSSKKRVTTETEGASNSKMLPIHCEVEFCKLPDCEKDESSQMGKDGYAIVPSNLKLQDLIQTALTKLEYQASLAKFSEGLIVIRNWKPLPFTSITEKLDVTVGDLFSDLLSQITLKIRVGVRHSEESFPSEWNDEAVRNVVKTLLHHMTQSHLARVSPLPQSMISNIVNKKYKSSISAGRCEAFGEWYERWCLTERNKLKDPKLEIDRNDEHCTQYTPKARVTFCPSNETPLLKTWFQECPFPTDEQLKQYCRELNELPIREIKGQEVTLKNLRIWWRNERVKEKVTMTQKEGNKEEKLGENVEYFDYLGLEPISIPVMDDLD